MCDSRSHDRAVLVLRQPNNLSVARVLEYTLEARALAGTGKRGTAPPGKGKKIGKLPCRRVVTIRRATLKGRQERSRL